jgi:flavodoxin I
MKILITYYSKTGNTEKIAKSMFEALKSENVDLLAIDKVSPNSIGGYDIMLLGSGIYASRIDKSILNLIKNAPNLPPKIAYFCTHASLNLYQTPFERVNKILESSTSALVGEFDCTGDNLGIPLEKQMDMLKNLPEVEKRIAEDSMRKIRGHPDENDLENAKKFAESLIKHLKV